MKKSLTILLILFSIVSYSQKQDSLITIKGVVIDAENKETIPFANVVIYKDSIQLAVAQTDFDGEFEINFTTKYINKNAKISFSFVGFSNLSMKIILKNQFITAKIKVDDSGCEFVTYTDSKINISNTTTGKTFSADDILHTAW